MRIWKVCFSCAPPPNSLDGNCTESRSLPICVPVESGSWMCVATETGNNKPSPGRRAARLIGVHDAESADTADIHAYPPPLRTESPPEPAFGRDTGA